jgi:hypothetical protein
VTVQVVDGNQREPARPRQGLGDLDAHEQRADQARSAGDRDALDVVERTFAERLANDGQHELQVAPGGDFGDDATVTRVQFRLRRDDVRGDLAFLRDERGGCLIATRLEGENHRRRQPPPCSDANTW